MSLPLQVGLSGDEVAPFWPWSPKPGVAPTDHDYVRYATTLVNAGFKYGAVVKYLNTPLDAKRDSSFRVFIADAAPDQTSHAAFQYQGSRTHNRDPTQDLNRTLASIRDHLNMAPLESVGCRIVAIELLSFQDLSWRPIIAELGRLLDLDPAIFMAVIEDGNATHIPLDWPRTFVKLYGRLVAQVLGFKRPSGEVFSVGESSIIL